MENHIEEKATALTDLEPKPLIQAQLDKFTKDSIRAHETISFNPKQALEILKAKEGSKVIGADFGGSKGLTQLFKVSGERLEPIDGHKDLIESNDGDKYMSSLEKTVRYAKEHNIPIGLSWGGPLDGTKALYHPKFENFLSELNSKYNNDFAKLLPTMKACLNDGPAGVVSGAVEANRTHAVSSLLFQINGSGVGMSVLSDGKIYAMEAGHVEAVDDLNIYGQTTPCGVFNASYVCLERIGSNKAGIEPAWKSKTNESLSALEIESRYKAGNKFAGELYDHSAYVVAHMVAGTARAFDIDLTSEKTAIVGHGGAFNFPHYGERVVQILEKYLSQKPKLIMTKDYGNNVDSNACLDGAALAALAS